MFDPSREQARHFFLESWRKARAGEPLTPMEQLAAAIIAEHPEYHATLSQAGVLERDFSVEDGQPNPFLHLSLHLAIEEQLSIDQPPGIRAAVQSLAARMERHDALHIALEALAETLHTAQRTGTAPDAHAYLTRLQQPAR